MTNSGDSLPFAITIFIVARVAHLMYMFVHPLNPTDDTLFKILYFLSEFETNADISSHNVFSTASALIVISIKPKLIKALRGEASKG